jgi:hypothetical protein
MYASLLANNHRSTPLKPKAWHRVRLAIITDMVKVAVNEVDIDERGGIVSGAVASDFLAGQCYAPVRRVRGQIQGQQGQRGPVGRKT